jgi:Do/DeqQ family serine protease
MWHNAVNRELNMRLKSILILVMSMVLVTGVVNPVMTAENGIDDIFRDTLDQLLGKNEAEQNEPGVDGQSVVPESRSQIQLSFSPVVKKVAPSVVNIYGTRRAPQFRSPFAGDPFFERFFGRQKRRQDHSPLGSGVIVSSDGVVLTNNHVIERMDDVKIVLADGREFECEIVLKDEKSDLAVLRIEGDATFVPIEIADSDAVEVGDLVLAVGNPFGVGQTVTSGIVSAVSRSLAGINDYGYFIQTDAAINPGNSGGALIDIEGRLIGINTMIFSKSGGSVGIGYAVPSNMTRVVLNSARTGNKVTRPWIGATFRDVTSEIAESLGMDRPIGALVLEVNSDSPADDAGLQRGDVVLEVNGNVVEHPDALGYRFDTAGVGKTAKITVLSRSKRKTLEVALIAPPETRPRDIRDMPENSVLWGARAANLSPAMAQEIGIGHETSGVVLLEVVRNSPAAFNGMQRGDIIHEINNVQIEDTETLEEIVQQNYPTWEFVVERGGKTFVFARNGGFFRQFLR